ncbi:MAG: DEAD/DEAH box helicase [Chitinophagales bacterium]|nr:DEAD/DEAH box helicase [Chitinophagales bacterium]
MDGFRALGLGEEILLALEKKGFEQPTPIQSLTIPLLLNGEKDVVGQAQTGTGKTAAFSLPIIEKFDEKSKKIQALVITPTRELALQVANEIVAYKGSKRMWITTVYGGAPIGKQMSELEKGTHVVVGTPGRIIDLIKRRKLILDDVKYVVLDEADEMLNMGFIDDIELILQSCNEDRRMLLFSATMPKPILQLAKRYMKDFEKVEVQKEELTNEMIDQLYYEVGERDRFDALCRVLDVEEDFYGIIFCNTKAEVIEICNHLNDKGYYADALHGDIQQNLREKVVKNFKQNKYGVLVATDVAARGIDIQDLTHVINYGLPQDPESYVHRIGRTGRAGKTGKAIAFVSRNEKRKMLMIERISNSKMQKVNLPDAFEMVKIKKNRIKDDIESIIETEHYEEYLTFALDLLKENDPTTLVAAVLKHFVKDELDPKSYKKIKESTSENYSKKVVRLFYAKGRQDGITPKVILNELKDKTGVDSRKINDIKIMQNFSFFNTNGDDAELILAVYKKNKGKRPIVERARERN